MVGGQATMITSMQHKEIGQVEAAPTSPATSLAEKMRGVRSMSRCRANRLGLILTAIFQLLLPAFVSVADAKLEAASARGAFAHIESHGTSDCAPAHSPDCALCRVILDGATASRAPDVHVSPACVLRASLAAYDGLAVGTLSRRGPSQRAPPVV
jgi:hypothetical protein